MRLPSLRRTPRLGVTADEIVEEWQDDLANNPIGAFGFSGHTPPFSTLDIETLSVKNSRRQDASAVYADLDGFTAYVGRNIATDSSAKHVVRALHVLRSELDAVLFTDFSGRKIRFIGDSVHGVAVEGTAQTTDAQETITNMTLCAAGMRSSFRLCIERLLENGTDATSLGLAVGFEYGPMTVTRLGMKGDLVRCSVSRGALAAEREQCRCAGTETAIGATAYESGTEAVRAVFGSSRKRAGLDYDAAIEELSARQRQSRPRIQKSGRQPPQAIDRSRRRLLVSQSPCRSVQADRLRMNWYIENPQRFRVERQELDNLAEIAGWLTPLGWTFDTSLRLTGTQTCA